MIFAPLRHNNNFQIFSNVLIFIFFFAFSAFIKATPFPRTHTFVEKPKTDAEYKNLIERAMGASQRQLVLLDSWHFLPREYVALAGDSLKSWMFETGKSDRFFVEENYTSDTVTYSLRLINPPTKHPFHAELILFYYRESENWDCSALFPSQKLFKHMLFFSEKDSTLRKNWALECDLQFRKKLKI